MSFRWRKRLSQTALALPVAIALWGCKGIETTKDIGFYAVTAKQTHIYRFAPGQITAADLTLKQGERLVMLRREYGYSRVMTGNGEKGFVATNDIGPAPPEPKGTAAGARDATLALTSGPRRGSGISSANRSVIQSGSLFGTGEVLPLPQDPDFPGIPPDTAPSRTPNPKPGFRVTVPKRNDTPPEKGPEGQ